MLRSLLHRVKPSRRTTQRPDTCRLAVESLEDRLTPAAILTISDATVMEGNEGVQNALVTVSLTKPHGNNVTVNYSTVNESAVASSDFTAVSGKLSFAKNETSKSIVIPIKGDRLVESDEYFRVQLSNAKGATIADGTSNVVITDDEPYAWVGYADVLEGNDDTRTAVFSVFLTSSYDRPVTVHYATADGSALKGLDYAMTEGSVTILAGQTNGEIVVPVYGDRLGEPSETFDLHLSTPNSYARMGNDTAVATINDDEPHIYISDAYLFEGSAITFTVTLSAAYAEEVRVNFTTMDGTAVAGVDYVYASGTVVFGKFETSKTITIELRDLTVTDKYFSVHLSDATLNAFIATESANGWWYYDSGYGGGYDYYYWYGGWDYYWYGYY